MNLLKLTQFKVPKIAEAIYYVYIVRKINNQWNFLKHGILIITHRCPNREDIHLPQ